MIRRMNGRIILPFRQSICINSAADDAANLAIAQRLRASEVSALQGARNLPDGQSLLRVAEGGLSSTSDLLIRMRELSVQGQNGTLHQVAKETIGR